MFLTTMFSFERKENEKTILSIILGKQESLEKQLTSMNEKMNQVYQKSDSDNQSLKNEFRDKFSNLANHISNIEHKVQEIEHLSESVDKLSVVVEKHANLLETYEKDLEEKETTKILLKRKVYEDIYNAFKFFFIVGCMTWISVHVYKDFFSIDIEKDNNKKEILSKPINLKV